MRGHRIALGVLTLVLSAGACSSESTEPTGSAGAGTGGTVGGSSGEAGLDCQGKVDAGACSACVEANCCGALAACADDPVCLACIENRETPGCSENAAAVDLAVCGFGKCETECRCIGLANGSCDVRPQGDEWCDCPDCLAQPNDYCLGTACVVDGTCELTDSCTCADCLGQCGCIVDGFCDQYNEACDCSDCANVPNCAGQVSDAGSEAGGS